MNSLTDIEADRYGLSSSIRIDNFAKKTVSRSPVDVDASDRLYSGADRKIRYVDDCSFAPNDVTGAFYQKEE